jgi:hypothetical protein
MPRTSARNSSEDRDVGLLQPGRGEDVDHLVRDDRPRHDLADRVVELLIGPPVAGRALGQDGAHRLEEADVVADLERRLVRDRERERLRELRDGTEEPRLAVLLGEDVLLRRRQHGQPLPRRA